MPYADHKQYARFTNRMEQVILNRLQIAWSRLINTFSMQNDHPLIVTFAQDITIEMQDMFQLNSIWPVDAITNWVV